MAQVATAKRSPHNALAFPEEAPKQALPFEVLSGCGAIELRYYGTVSLPDMRTVTQPYRFTVGDPNYPVGCSPIGLAILELIREYQAVVQLYDRLHRAYTDQISHIRALEGQVKTQELAIQGYKSRDSEARKAAAQ